MDYADVRQNNDFLIKKNVYLESPICSPSCGVILLNGSSMKV